MQTVQKKKKKQADKQTYLHIITHIDIYILIEYMLI